MTQQLTTDPDDPKAVKAAVAQALAEMKAAIADEAQGVEHAFKAALTLGANAAIVRGLLGSGTFSEWFEKNFGEGTKRPYSIQWIYKCIGASLAFAALPKPKRERDAIMARFGTIKGLASIRTKLEQGEDVLALPAPEKAQRGAPTKAQRAQKAAQAAAPAAAPCPCGRRRTSRSAKLRALAARRCWTPRRRGCKRKRRTSPSANRCWR